MRVRSNDVVFRDRVRRDRCRAFEVRDFVVRQVVGTFAREVVVADVPRPLAIRAVKRCTVRVVHAAECRIQSCLRIAIRDAGYIAVAVLRFVELRTIDRRRVANLNRQVGLRDARRVCEDLRRLAAFELVVAIRQRRLDVILTVADVLRLDRIPCLVVDIRRRRSRVADLFIAVDALDLDFDRSRRVAIDRREMRVRSNDVVFRDCVRCDLDIVLAIVNKVVVTQDITITRKLFLERIRRIARIVRTGIIVKVCPAIVLIINLDIVFIAIDEGPRREWMCSIFKDNCAVFRSITTTVDYKISFFDRSLASRYFRIVVIEVIIEEVPTILRFETDRIITISICRPDTIGTILGSGIHILLRKKIELVTNTCIQGFSRIAIDNAVRIRVSILRLVKCRAIRGSDVANPNLQLCFSNIDMTIFPFSLSDVIIGESIKVFSCNALLIYIVCVKVAICICCRFSIHNLIRRCLRVRLINRDMQIHCILDSAFVVPRYQAIQMDKVVVHLIVDGIAIAIRCVNIIRNAIQSPLCQDSFACTGRNIIICIDRILQIRRKNGIDIITALLNIIGTSFAINFDQSLRRTIDRYRGFAIIIAIGQASKRYSIFKSILDSIYVAIDLLKTISRDGQICFVDFKVTLCLDDFVVDACTILEADIFHIDGIRIRLFIGISCRTSSLVASIETAGLNGKVICAIVERVVIFFDKGFARCAFLIASERCSECPVVDGCGAVGLAAAAVDVDLASENLDGAAVFCGCIGIAARFTKIRQIVAI